MLKPIETKIFRKDLKRISKRGKNINKLKEIILLLVKQELLPDKNKDHELIGNYKNHRECHIEPDWLLIYNIKENILNLVRTGTHADLFDK